MRKSSLPDPCSISTRGSTRKFISSSFVLFPLLQRAGVELLTLAAAPLMTAPMKSFRSPLSPAEQVVPLPLPTPRDGCSLTYDNY